jgi:hypothetical protein
MNALLLDNYKRELSCFLCHEPNQQIAVVKPLGSNQELHICSCCISYLYFLEVKEDAPSQS